MSFFKKGKTAKPGRNLNEVKDSQDLNNLSQSFTCESVEEIKSEEKDIIKLKLSGSVYNPETHSNNLKSIFEKSDHQKNYRKSSISSSSYWYQDISIKSDNEYKSILIY